jgi:CarboxypepD_reg-like domain
MKQLVLLLIAGLFAVNFFGQQTNQFLASGIVVDAVSKQPLSGASVFCQNTTAGTVSAADGSFLLRLPVGGYDLIVSYTGYETFEMRINAQNAERLHIVLKQKDKSLEEVSVVSSNEVLDGLAKYGQFFNDNFIGTTANASQCKLQNPEALQFYFSKKKNRLKIKAREDLIIVNDALGYKIKFQLDSFAHEYGTGTSIYAGFPFFEEMRGDSVQMMRWSNNRKRAYAGSRLHFMRSWYDSTLLQEGFAIEMVDTQSVALKTVPLHNVYDSSIYRVVENRDVEISYNGKLRIIYKNETPDADYLAKNKLPDHIRSQITILVTSEGFIIERNGYFYDQNEVANSGYWAWEKLADEVPYDYRPK